MWESTLQPEYFFNKLKEYDQVWVPSQWQADCIIAQGMPIDKYGAKFNELFKSLV